MKNYGVARVKSFEIPCPVSPWHQQAWSCLLMSHVAWNMGGSRYPKWMVYSGKSDKMDDIEKQIKKSGSKYL